MVEKKRKTIVQQYQNTAVNIHQHWSRRMKFPQQHTQFTHCWILFPLLLYLIYCYQTSCNYFFKFE